MVGELVVQEEGMGCGIACVASALGITYQEARKLSDRPERSYTTGYYCEDLVKMLNKKGKNYSTKKYNLKDTPLLEKQGTIVFVKEGEDDIWGHYLVKTSKGWMDSWVNWPSITPAKASYHKDLIGEPQWIIYDNTKV